MKKYMVKRASDGRYVEHLSSMTGRNYLAVAWCTSALYARTFSLNVARAVAQRNGANIVEL